jgi:predicted phage terminase large subunit-like protein
MSFSPADRLVARASPAAFASLVSGGAYRPFEHLVRLDEQLTALAFGELDRLLVSMPPRHGKSETVSRYMPAWYLGRFPERRVMLASYEAGLALSFSRRARDLLAEFGPELFGVRVAERSAAAKAWDLRGHAGGMVAAGVGGPLTGRGAHLLIIDDPVKNAEEAASQAYRDRAWDWWRSTARSRLQQGGAVVLVMTRWHEDDLAGRLLAEQAEGWSVLELPALAEPGDPLGRSAGAALCPELFDEPALARSRRDSGAYFWAALYQQRPLPADGGVFRKSDFRYFEEEDEHYVLHTDAGKRRVATGLCQRFVTCDPALSSKQTADYTALCLFAVTPERELLLLDVARERFEQPDQKGFIKRYYEQHRPFAIYVEAAAQGLGLIQELRREGLSVFPVQAETDKVTRARGAVARYESHDVYHRRGAAWLLDYEQELCGFPQGAHDDQVDCFSYAARVLPTIAAPLWRPRRQRGRTHFGGLREKPL